MTTRRTSGFLALSLGVLLASGVGFASTAAMAKEPTKKIVTLTVTELPAQVRLVPGESVDLRLSTNLTTGYSWSTRVAGKKGAITVSAGRYQAPTTELVGAPGTTTWTVTARSVGTATVHVLTTPPGGGAPQSAGALRVIVQ